MKRGAALPTAPETLLRAGRPDGFTCSAPVSECPQPMRTRKSAPTIAITQFVAARYGDTPEEDRAFRREQVSAALADTLYRLRLRQAMAEIEARQAKRPTTPES